MRAYERFCKAGVIATVLLSATVATAEDERPAELKVGDPVPEFEALDDNGEKWKSASHVGRDILVVYFYPADMTPGCTKQACGFRDAIDELDDLDVTVVGVSGDSVKNHQLFKKAHDLNFTLLADEDGSVAKKFGVPLRSGSSIERVIDGTSYTLDRGVTAARWTFVIDRDGKIAAKNTTVNAAEDAEWVKETVQRLKEKPATSR